MKRGIKARLVWSYLLLIIVTVLLFESIILSALRFYYIEGVKQTLRDQGTMFINFYEQDLSEKDLGDVAQDLLERYHFLVSAQVQIIDQKGEVVASSQGVYEKVNQVKDVATALKGETGYWTGNLNGEDLLSVSQPIIQEDKVTGAVRFTTSMAQLNQVFKENAVVLLGIGAIVIIIALLISYFLARTITKPVSRITIAAEQMASGKFSTRVPKGKSDELGKLADTLNYMAQEIERHEMLKNEFIASVSHELRTPLTSVKGWAITLHSMSDDKFFKEGLEIISSESDRLSQLLGDLLDFSSLASGKVQFRFEEVSLATILNQVCTQLSPRAERQGIKLNIGVDSPVTIRGDLNRLKQVVINVLDNALKFTPTGGDISVTLHHENNHAIIKISDSGEGIAEEELKFVTEKFHKGKTKASGSGLGLAICQEIILAHHGTFQIASKKQQGTSVEITLPV
ncbi:ATP-binding protein [Cytobacillus sp. FJAT-54145]|uniref:histidine kinase n=1 Tax=Cytobacillus spartinae TaxID=3299023 RepID=A0ABW6K8L9_9BACI